MEIYIGDTERIILYLNLRCRLLFGGTKNLLHRDHGSNYEEGPL